MNGSMIAVAYALVTTFAAAAAVWFALVWHDAKMDFGDLSVKYMKLFRDYSDARAEASMANWYAKRALEAEAKLRFADEYGNDQYDNAQSRDAKDACLYQTFEQWLEVHKGMRMETKTNVNEVQQMVHNAKAEIIAILNKLISDLPPGYLVTDCRTVILRADLMGGENRVFIDGCDITVEVAL